MARPLALADNATIITDIPETAEQEWSEQLFRPGEDAYKLFTDHPVLIHHFSWTSADTGMLCINQNLIRQYVQQSTLDIRRRIANFYYLKSDIKLTFVVQGAAQCGGMLAFSAYPAPKAGVRNSAIFGVAENEGLANCRIVPHVLIDPSKSQSLELILPMCTTTGYYMLSSNSVSSHPDYCGSWELDRRVIVPLVTGTENTATISVCVYMSFVNPTFIGMRQYVGLAPPMQFEKKPTGSLSSIAFGVSKIASHVGHVFPTLGPTANVFSVLGGLAGQALQFLGFAKPQAIENNVFITNRNCDNYSQVDGISTSLVLGRSQGQTVSIAPGYIGGDLDEMSIDYIASKPAIVYQFTIPLATGTQTLVTTFPVRPTLSDTLSSYPPLKALARIHDLWCGDITYTFEFVASVFHRTTILIAWSPDDLAGVPDFNSALSALKNTTVYVSGNTTTSITIPWTQPQPTRPCNNASGTNGVIYVYIINPVQTNGSTDPVYVNVLAHSDNIAFLLPDIFGTRLATIYKGYDEEQSEFVPTTVVPFGPPIDWVPVVPISFGQPTNIKNVGSAVTGDRTLSVKDLISRMSLSMIIPAQATNNMLELRPFPMTQGSPTVFGFLTWFLPAYNGSRGSTRVSLNYQRTNNEPVFASYVPDPTNDIIIPGNIWSTVTPDQVITDAYAFTSVNPTNSSNIDVVVPMTISTNFYPGRNTGNAGGGSSDRDRGYTGFLHFGPMPPDSKPLVWKGAGDDFVLSSFIGFPNKL